LKPKILLISSHPKMARPFRLALEANGYPTCENRISHLDERKPNTDQYDLVVMFWKADQFIQSDKTELSSYIDALFILGNPKTSHQIQTYQNGVYNLCVRENDTRKFIRQVEALLGMKQNIGLLREPVSVYRAEEGEKPAIDDLIGKNPQMARLRRFVQHVAESPTLPVLITGETGTGKELVADILHHASARADKPMIKINCSAIPENLLESQLFGHKRGAFTGALSDQVGLFEQADGGTLLLDEIGAMSLNLQPKLLRFLEDKTFYWVGGTTKIRVDVWILASTNADLVELMDRGLFRKDLYYRLNSVKFHIPPLRERTEDIPLLVEAFAGKMGVEPNHLQSEVIEHLSRCHWDGNVRELRNVVECLLKFGDTGIVDLKELPLKEDWKKEEPEEQVGLTLEDAERAHILRIFLECKQKIKPAAKMLGIDRNTLKKKLVKFGICDS
jgi:two-component system response regulator AtoC